MGTFKSGERVLLVDERRGKRHMLKLQEKGTFSTQYGAIQFPDLLNCEDGDYIYTHKGIGYRIYSLRYIDYVMNIKRRAQIIYPKDTAAMLMWGDIYPGLNVLESGVGQGAFSIALLRALAGQGHLTSYELREDFAGDAKKFIGDYLGEVNNHTIEVRNIYEGIDGVYDRIMLDLPEPWHVIPHSLDALKDGGIMIAYLPTILQVKEHVDRLRVTRRYEEIEVFEFTNRPWKVDGMSVRPEMWVYNHSAFIISARKVKRAMAFIPPVTEEKEDAVVEPECDCEPQMDQDADA